jgi:lysophospholipase L1-like esterase
MIKKIVSYNLLVFFILIIVLELSFGYWFDPENFGIHMRKHRNINEFYNITINDNNYKFEYKRNFYGFRDSKNEELGKIKYVFLGGSTGNERFLPQKLSIVGRLNSLFDKKKSTVKIVNASVDGKTSKGHINDFNFWFPKLKNFNPNYFLVYVGINDAVLNQDEKYDLTFDDNFFKNSRDYLTNNSLLIEIIKKFKWRYFKSTTLEYEINKTADLYENFFYIDYEKAKKIHNLKFLKLKHENLYERYKDRIAKLSKEILNKKSTIIFITQVKYNGLKDEKLFLLNETLKEFSVKNNIDIIKLDESFKGSKNDFYDKVHTTEQGSHKIAILIYDRLKSLIDL